MYRKSTHPLMCMLCVSTYSMLIDVQDSLYGCVMICTMLVRVFMGELLTAARILATEFDMVRTH